MPKTPGELPSLLRGRKRTGGAPRPVYPALESPYHDPHHPTPAPPLNGTEPPYAPFDPQPLDSPLGVQSPENASPRPPSTPTLWPLEMPSDKTLEHFSKLIALDGSPPLSLEQLRALIERFNRRPVFYTRTERKRSGGQRHLLVPQDPELIVLYARLAKLLGQFSMSPEAIAFRRGLCAAKGVRQMIDEYEGRYRALDLPLAHGHPVIGRSFHADIRNYYPSIKLSLVERYLRERFVALLSTALPQEDAHALADFVAQLACPGEGLPQGVSTSPAIANGVGVELDKRLRKALRGILGKSTYGIRFADDLWWITHDRDAPSKKVWSAMGGILGDFGLKLHPDKSEVKRGVRGRPYPGEIHGLGLVVSNGTPVPLHFKPRVQVIHQAEKALEWMLENDLKLDDPDSPDWSHVQRVLGVLNYIHDTLLQGHYDGQRLRHNVTRLLPPKLERLFEKFLKRYGQYLSRGQQNLCRIPRPKPAPKKSTKSPPNDPSAEPLKAHAKKPAKHDPKSYIERRPEPTPLVTLFDDAFRFFKWKFRLDADAGNGGQAVIYARNEDGTRGKPLRTINKARLQELGFPMAPVDATKPSDATPSDAPESPSNPDAPPALSDLNPAPYDTFFNDTVIPALNNRIKAWATAVQEKEITAVQDLHHHPEIQAQFNEILLDLIEWHLVALLNIPGLDRSDFKQLVGADHNAGTLASDNETQPPSPPHDSISGQSPASPFLAGDQPQPLFPGKLLRCFRLLEEEWEEYFGHFDEKERKWQSDSFTERFESIFTNPQRERQVPHLRRALQRRTGAGGTLDLPQLSVRLDHGVPKPFTPKKRRRRRKRRRKET